MSNYYSYYYYYYYLIRALFRALSHRNYVFSLVHATGLDLSNSNVGAEYRDMMLIVVYGLEAFKHLALAIGHMAIASFMLLKCCIQHPAITVSCACIYSRIYCTIMRS